MTTGGWDDIKPSTKTGHWEQYWRSGYQVGDATPVVVYDFHRSVTNARTEALATAREAAVKVAAAGVELPVVPFVEVWRTQTRTTTQTAPRDLLEPINPSVSRDGEYVLVPFGEHGPQTTQVEE